MANQQKLNLKLPSYATPTDYADQGITDDEISF